MSALSMSVVEREAFLADVHVGVLSIPREGQAPLTAPLWYDYQPGGDYWIYIGTQSLKAKALRVGEKVSLVAQTESAPYKYVSVEGVVSAIAPDNEGVRSMAIRYLGEEMGAAYADASQGDNVRVSVTPARWLTVDYGKM